ncbi:MAG: hypothetical protein P8Y44_12220, partial [Acidobacteriota bacterium]
MYRIAVLVCAALLLASFAVQVQAQDDDTPGPFVYGTYSVCDLGQQWKLDGLVEENHAKVYDKALEDGAITAWGYMAHNTGGHWRRVTYYSAPALDQLMSGAESIFEAIRTA